MNPLATVQVALELANVRLKEMPSYVLYSSIVNQLEYLKDVLVGDIPIDRPKLRTIIIGHYGLREFEESDPEFSSALKNAQVIASKMAQGLKL